MICTGIYELYKNIVTELSLFHTFPRYIEQSSASTPNRTGMGPHAERIVRLHSAHVLSEDSAGDAKVQRSIHCVVRLLGIPLSLVPLTPAD